MHDSSSATTLGRVDGLRDFPSCGMQSTHHHESTGKLMLEVRLIEIVNLDEYPKVMMLGKKIIW